MRKEGLDLLLEYIFWSFPLLRCTEIVDKYQLHYCKQKHTPLKTGFGSKTQWKGLILNQQSFSKSLLSILMQEHIWEGKTLKAARRLCWQHFRQDSTSRLCCRSDSTSADSCFKGCIYQELKLLQYTSFELSETVKSTHIICIAAMKY